MSDLLAETMVDAFDRGVIFALTNAVMILETCRDAELPIQLAIDALAKLRDNPPPRSTE